MGRTRVKPLHDFAKSFKTGEIAEHIVKEYLEKEGWTVEQVPQPEMKQDGDFYIFHPGFCNNKRLRVEVKCDIRAEQTRNLFIETQVNYDYKKVVDDGWARYSIAEYIYWYFPTANTIWVVPMQKVQANLDDWSKKYRTAKAYNKGWHGIGLLVPAKEIWPLLEQRIEL